MNLKLLAFLTIVLAAIFIVCTFIFDIPLAYIPEKASNIEVMTYYVIFFTLEVIITTFLLMYMLKKSNLDDAICNFFDK